MPKYLRRWEKVLESNGEVLGKQEREAGEEAGTEGCKEAQAWVGAANHGSNSINSTPERSHCLRTRGRGVCGEWCLE